MGLKVSAVGRAVVLAATVLVVAGASVAEAKKKANSQSAAGGERPLRGTIHWHGGYSYGHTQTVSPSWRFIDPGATRQTPSGPFDNGFFFDSGQGPHGGQAPYQN